jgi:glutathione synthase/RimK-type ligase-like ATP-grasp enzyme
VRTLVVVSNPKDWPFDIPGVSVVGARAYLTESEYLEGRTTKVFNLCRSYRYQSMGYYVSLLAAARGHRPVPSISTIQDMKAAEIVRIRSDDLEDLIAKSLGHIVSDTFVLSIYFGRNVARRYERLCARLFGLFHAPLVRAQFARSTSGEWQLQRVAPISAGEIPTHHHEFVVKAATEYFAARRWNPSRPSTAPYDLAILHDPAEVEPPSDERAIKKFMKAARALGMEPTVVGRDDYARLGEYDALFIRETTNVNHHTYRFARRAQTEGLVVVDDPESIVRCTNKIYLAELMNRHQIRIPKTLVVQRDGIDRIQAELGLPCVLKQPDSAFSQGVVKATTEQELFDEAERLLTKSELIVAQSYMPTDFDWRVGVFDGQPLWACRYFMADGHWQIVNNQQSGKRRSGRVQAVKLDDVPHHVVRTAVRASHLIGDGLYGVDLKEIGRKVYLVEVNDNPSIDVGYEDGALGDELYMSVMRVFAKRLEALHQARGVGAEPA